MSCCLMSAVYVDIDPEYQFRLLSRNRCINNTTLVLGISSTRGKNTMAGAVRTQILCVDTGRTLVGPANSSSIVLRISSAY
jgi:hypothetical protein